MRESIGQAMAVSKNHGLKFPQIQESHAIFQDSESQDGCCYLRRDLRQMILDHESRLALYFDSDIAKLLDLTTTGRNRQQPVN